MLGVKVQHETSWTQICNHIIKISNVSVPVNLSSSSVECSQCRKPSSFRENITKHIYTCLEVRVNLKCSGCEKPSCSTELLVKHIFVYDRGLSQPFQWTIMIVNRVKFIVSTRGQSLPHPQMHLLWTESFTRKYIKFHIRSIQEPKYLARVSQIWKCTECATKFSRLNKYLYM